MFRHKKIVVLTLSLITFLLLTACATVSQRRAAIDTELVGFRQFQPETPTRILVRTSRRSGYGSGGFRGLGGGGSSRVGYQGRQAVLFQIEKSLKIAGFSVAYDQSQQRWGSHRDVPVVADYILNIENIIVTHQGDSSFGRYNQRRWAAVEIDLTLSNQSETIAFGEGEARVGYNSRSNYGFYRTRTRADAEVMAAKIAAKAAMVDLLQFFVQN